MPRVFLPAVVVVGIWGIFESIALFLDPEEETVRVAGSLLMLGAVGLHGVLLHAVFRDGRALLGERLPLDGRRAVIVYVLSCFLAKIWTALAFGLLLRAAVQEASARESPLIRSLRRHLKDVRTLFAMACLDLLVGLGFLLMLTSRGEGLGLGVEEISTSPPIRILGSFPVTVMALFHITVHGYYVTFVLRAIPAVYRSFRT